MINFDKTFVLDFAKHILNIDSPSSYTKHAIAYVKEQAKALGYETFYNHKGNLFIKVVGKDEQHTTGICAHCDTLGLMVRSIKSDGHLAITKIGGPIMPTLDGEYCRIHTRDNKIYTGTILSTSPAAHVYPDANTLERKDTTMEVRIDEIVNSVEDVKALGIQNGDIIAIEPKVDITDSGFIKSRFLDDKISVAAIMGVLKALHDNHIKPEKNLYVMMSTYEEVGHGASHLPDEIEELLAVDMGCIGLDLACSEQDVSICAKDSRGPYDYDLTSKLIELAKANALRYAVDIYPQYGSDVTAALAAGNNIKGALIGPGVHASHGMERTHYDGVENTMKLIFAYLTNEA